MRVHLVVLVLPVVEPAGVELRVHAGTSLGVAHLRIELDGDVVAGAEVDGGVDVLGERAALELVVVSAIVGEEHHVVAEKALVQVQQPLEVHLVAGGVEAVLVLDLDHDDVASVLVQVGTHQGEQHAEEVLHVLLVHGIGGSQLDAGNAQQPVGQTAKVPLAADVGTGAEDHVEVVLLGQLNEANDVGNPLEIELALVRLVEIPGNVGLHGIQTALGHLLQRVVPVLVVLAGLLAEVVEGAGHVGEGLSIHLKVVVNDLERSLT